MQKKTNPIEQGGPNDQPPTSCPPHSVLLLYPLVNLAMRAACGVFSGFHYRDRLRLTQGKKPLAIRVMFLVRGSGPFWRLWRFLSQRLARTGTEKGARNNDAGGVDESGLPYPGSRTACKPLWRFSPCAIGAMLTVLAFSAVFPSAIGSSPPERQETAGGSDEADALLAGLLPAHRTSERGLFGVFGGFASILPSVEGAVLLPASAR
jgi:hypothetical protein